MANGGGSCIFGTAPLLSQSQLRLKKLSAILIWKKLALLRHMMIN